jgi:excisionase family DNA binding protein
MDRLLTMDEVSDLLRTPVPTLRFWRHRGTGPTSLKIGRRVMYRGADLDAWLERQSERAA